MTTGGVVKTFRVPASVYSRSWPTAMVVGPEVAHVDPAGVERGTADQMVAGADTVWLAQSKANRIARISC